MSDIHPDDIEAFCEQLHNAYEEAALLYGWSTQAVSRVDWADVPEANKATMRAAVAAVLPAHDHRLREQVLNEAADDLPAKSDLAYVGEVAAWLRARAYEAGQ